MQGLGTKPKLIWNAEAEQDDFSEILDTPSIGERLKTAIEAQGDRFWLWSAVCFGSGIAFYFALPFEPPLYPLILLTLISLAATKLLWTYVVWRQLFLAFCLILCGSTIATYRTARIAAPVIKEEIGPITIEAKLVKQEFTERGFLRLTLAPVHMEKVENEDYPKFIRLNVRTKAPDLDPGDKIKLRAVLHPPPEPVAPGAFDFARQSYFNQLGAVGYAVSSPVITDRGQPKFGLKLETYRNHLTQRIISILDGSSGAIATALLTGDKSAIPENISQAYRDAGLAHLLAISGLHFGLIASLLFAATRFMLALNERLALTHPIKSYAAIIAWLGALAYLGLTGAPIAAQRAFIMISLMLLALLIGRQALSLRLVITAALVILLISPEALLNVGFQMSFAAVIALVAAYEALSPWFAKLREKHTGVMGRGAVYLISIALSTLIAEIAIAPIAAFHFNQFSTYGLFANMLAVPLTAFWIMPWGAIALLLSPFGLEQFALIPMGQGIEILTQIATTTAAAPGAHHVTSAYPLGGFVLIILAGLCFTLWRGWMRLTGLPLLFGALIAILMGQHPNMLVSPDGRMVAVNGDNSVLISTKRGSGLTKDVWTRRWGEEVPIFWLDAPEFQEKHQIACDDEGCTFFWPDSSKPVLISYANTQAAIFEDCRQTTLLITSLDAGNCKQAPWVIDANRLHDEGAQAIYFDNENGITVKSTKAYRGQRPWVRTGY